MASVNGHTSDLAVRAADPAASASVARDKMKPQTATRDFGTERAGFSRVEFDKAVSQIQKFIQENPKVNLSVAVDDTLNRPVMRVLDPDNGEVMQIPSEEVVKIAQNIELMRGVFFDRKA